VNVINPVISVNKSGRQAFRCPVGSKYGSRLVTAQPVTSRVEGSSVLKK
jgi:hypothetical protein